MTHTHHYTLIKATGETEQGSMTSDSHEPGYHAIKAAISGYFDEPFEHVAVLHKGKRTDMFVGETSSINGRHARNDQATAIYRNNSLTRDPDLDPESIPDIKGPAVVFAGRVWF